MPPLRCLAAALLAVGLTGSAAAAQPEPSDGSGVELDALEIVGAAHVSEAELREALLTTERGWRFWRANPFDEESLREDLDRVAAFYRDRGYFEAGARYELEWNANRTRVRATIRVDPGEPVRLAGWSIDVPGGSWLDDADRRALVDGLPLAEGEPFGAIRYREVKDALLRRFAKRGHPAARLEGGLDVDLATHTAQLRWRVAPGPSVRFGDVSIAGLDDVDERLVRRELTFAPGEPFSIEALESSRRAIYDLDLFRGVTLSDRRPPPDPARDDDPQATVAWPVKVELEERPPRTIRISAGYGSEDEFRGQIAWSHRNFFGGARRFQVKTKYSSLLAGGEVSLKQRRFLDPRTDLDAEVAFFRETVPAFDALRFSTGITLSRPLAGPWKGRVGHRFEWSDVTDLKADESVGDGSARSSTLVFGVNRSTIDDTLDPRSGTWLDLSVAPTLRWIGSEESYVQLMAEGRAYLPVGPTTLAARLRAGTIQPVAGSGRADVPTVTRFFAGGSGSVRGFEFQQMPPLDADRDPLGGLTLLEGSLEVRFPIWRWFRGLVFFDAGQLDAAPFGFATDAVYASVGPGLRVVTPVGSLGLDYGILLRRPAGLDRGRIHFSVGTTF